ncbi:MAG: hypothetical protein ACRD1U_08620, partial [Vicinamibacterales bacterium]
TGPLLRQLPPIVPRRIGRLRADAPGVFRTDAFTVLRVVPEAEHAELLLPFPAGGAVIEIAPSPTCDLPSCGFDVGSTALVTAADGTYDLFTVLAVTGRTLSLRHLGTGAHPPYAAGSPVLVAETATFHLDTAAHILRRYDGDSADDPSVDDVVGVGVEYYGGGEPPRWPRGVLGVGNCLYESDGTYRSALLPILPGPVPSAVPLTGAMLSDGPWCGIGGNRFDADLLRVRQVRVTLRLQASDPAVRGADRGRFRVPGVASQGGAMVQDVTVVAGVGPRNLRTGW